MTRVALTEACLRQIDTSNPKLNASLTVLGDQALEEAKVRGGDLRAGRLCGPLHGFPIALKHNIDTAGVRTAAPSGIFDDRVLAEEAEVTQLWKAAGAALIGKLNLHQFTFDGTSATSCVGLVRNPGAPDRSLGGSSGGSAVAAAAGMCFGAVGTDIGGSIRTPASPCGIVGSKPTSGLVPLRAIIPLALPRDHCGPMMRTAEDAALLLNVLAGYDRPDIPSVDHPPEDDAAALRQSVKSFRPGIPRAPFLDHCDAEVAQAVETATGLLNRLKRGSRKVALPKPAEHQPRDLRPPRALLFLKIWRRARFPRGARRKMAPAPGPTSTSRPGGNCNSCGAPWMTVSATWIWSCCPPAAARPAPSRRPVSGTRATNCENRRWKTPRCFAPTAFPPSRSPAD